MPQSSLRRLRVLGRPLRVRVSSGPSFPVGAVAIDAAWLSANAATYGGPPYVLDQAGAYYYLTTDVTTPGTGFCVGANDVTLDLNGRTLTFNDAHPPINPTNYGFESDAIGTTASVDAAGNVTGGITGWDLSRAPGSSFRVGSNAADATYLEGNNYLAWTCPAPLSATIAIVDASHVQFTTAVAHGFATGQQVVYGGFAGSPAAGLYEGGQANYVTPATITSIDSATAFTVSMALASISTASGYVMRRQLIRQLVSVPYAYHTYCAAGLVCEGSEVACVTLADSSGNALPFYSDYGGTSGVGPHAGWAWFFPTTTASVYVQADHHCPSSAAATTCRLDRVVFSRCNDYGVTMGSGRQYWWLFAPGKNAKPASLPDGRSVQDGAYDGRQNYPLAIQQKLAPSSTNADSTVYAKVISSRGMGAIVQGRAAGQWCSGVHSYGYFRTVIQNIAFAMSGDDSMGISGLAKKYDQTISGCTVTWPSGGGPQVHDRQNISLASICCAIGYTGTNNDVGNVTISGCTVNDGYFSGIYAGYNAWQAGAGNAGQSTLIDSCVVYPRMTMTNGYGILPGSNATVRNCTIDATAPGRSGRGILAYADPANGNVIHDLLIDGCTVLVSESRNREYTTGGSPARAYFVRNYNYHNVTVRDSTFRAAVRPGGMTGGAALRFMSTYNGANDWGTSSGGNTTTTLNDALKSWASKRFTAAWLHLRSGPYAGTEYRVASNTATQLTLDPATPFPGDPGACDYAVYLTRNIQFTGNTFESYIDSATDPGASYSSPGVIFDNVMVGPPFAVPEIYEPLFQGNTFKGADCSIQLCGGDASNPSFTINNLRIRDNTFSPTSFGYQGRAYSTHSTLGATPVAVNAGSFGDSYVGCTRTVAWGGSPSKTLDFGERLTVVVSDSGANPISGATCTVTDTATGRQVGSGTTDGTGSVTFDVVTRELAGTTAATAADYASLQLAVAASGHATDTRAITLPADATVGVTLS